MLLPLLRAAKTSRLAVLYIAVVFTSVVLMALGLTALVLYNKVTNRVTPVTAFQSEGRAVIRAPWNTVVLENPMSAISRADGRQLVTSEIVAREMVPVNSPSPRSVASSVRDMTNLCVALELPCRYQYNYPKQAAETTVYKTAVESLDWEWR